jgi:UDP-GlcNAc:undecaprenyl-phosphate GlcNAc-1-phosphate transferase
MLQQGNIIGILFFSIILGSIIGFLIRNFKPAFYIMGDCGSNLLGFIISILSLYSFKEVDMGINIMYPLIFLSVPLLDMFFVISKRILNKKSPFYPDRNHLHHRLLKIGFNEFNTVQMIYFIVLFTLLILIFKIKIS